MAIVDYALNPLNPTTLQFLGYRQGEAEEFPHDIYRFIIKSIRDHDQAEDQLIQRWLGGPQQEFESTYARIKELLEVYDPTRTKDDTLPYLRWIVGLTDSVMGVTGTPTDEELRRLISVAVRMWKFKGSVKGMVDMVRAVTTYPARLIDYFRFRTIVDEWEVGWAELDIDPWLVDQPGFQPAVEPDAVTDLGGGVLEFTIDGLLGAGEAVSHDIRVKHTSYPGDLEVRPSFWDGTNNKVHTTTYLGQPTPSTDPQLYRVGVDPDEYVSDLRVVDDGTVNRTLLEGLVSLLRPAGERIYIRYLDFQDDFRDVFSWDVISGTATPDRPNGILELEDTVDTVIATDFPNDDTWTEIRAGCQLKLQAGDKWGEFRFYYTDESNFYAVRINPAAPSLTLERVTGGTRTVLDTTVLAAFHTDVYYFIHVQTDDTGSGHQLRYHLDGNLLGDVVDSDHSAGRLAVASETGQKVTLTLVDMYQEPLESTRIGPQ